MANIIARFLEKKLAVMFDNFQAGKNAKSSLLKGEGEATDLYLSKKFLNGMLPPRFSVSKASCKKLKWQLALMTLGKDPLVITLEGLDILVEETVKPDPERAGKKKDKKKKKKKKKSSDSKSKRNAILEGIKVQVINLKVRVQLQHGSLHRTPGAPPPFGVFEIERISVFNTNSQWQEVTDLGKIHVVNQNSGESLAFKRVLISGLSLSVFDSAQIPFTSDPEDPFQPCKMLNNVRILGGLAAKRRITDWKLIAFKYELEIQELKVRLGRRELFMVRHFLQGVLRASKKEKDPSSSKGAGLGSQVSDENLPDSDDEEKEEPEEFDHDSLDSILQAQKTLWTEGDENWCGYIDNSISVYLKMAELAAHQNEETDSPGFLILLSLFQLRFWPAQGQLGKALPGKAHNQLDITAQFFTIKEVNPTVPKPTAHLSLLSPKPGKDGQAVLNVRVHAETIKRKELGSSPTPIKVDLHILPLSVVLDLVVWRRLFRFFAGGALEKAWYSERKKENAKKERKADKKAAGEAWPPFVISVITDSINLVAPAYEGAHDDHLHYEEAVRVNELRAHCKGINFKLKTSDRYECPLRDGLFAPRGRSFPAAPGDFEPASVAQSFQSRVPLLLLSMDALSLGYCKDSCEESNEKQRRVLLLDSITFGLVKHKPDASSDAPKPKFEIWLEIEREANIEWGIDHTGHVKNLWDAFSKGPEAQALHDEEEATELMVKALEAAREGADKFNKMDSQKRSKVKENKTPFKFALSIRVNHGKFTGKVEGLEGHVNFNTIDFVFEKHASSQLFKAYSQGLEFFLRQPEQGGDDCGGGGGHLKLRFETHKEDADSEEDGADQGGGEVERKKLQAKLLAVEAEGLCLSFDIRALKKFKGLLTGGGGAYQVKKEIKPLQPKSSKLPEQLAGLHVLFSLNKVDLDFRGVLPGLRDCPISSSLRHVTLHNRAILENPTSRLDGNIGNYLGHHYGSPTSISVWQKDKIEKQVPGLDGLERLRRTEDEVMAALEALETSFVVGPLATVEASSHAAGDGGEFIAGVTAVQLSGFLDELQRTRRSLAGMYKREGLENTKVPKYRGGKENGVSSVNGGSGNVNKLKTSQTSSHTSNSDRGGSDVVKGLQNSINLTRTCLQVLLDEFELEDEDDSDEESMGKKSEADAFDIDENLNGMTADEMVEAFKMFCADGSIRREFEMLQSMETGPEIKEVKPTLPKSGSSPSLATDFGGGRSPIPAASSSSLKGPTKSSSKFGGLSAKVEQARASKR